MPAVPASFIYVTDPGYPPLKSGKGFRYVDPDSHPVTDKAT